MKDGREGAGGFVIGVIGVLKESRTWRIIDGRFVFLSGNGMGGTDMWGSIMNVGLIRNNGYNFLGKNRYVPMDLLISEF